MITLVTVGTLSHLSRERDVALHPLILRIAAEVYESNADVIVAALKFVDAQDASAVVLKSVFLPVIRIARGNFIITSDDISRRNSADVEGVGRT